MGCGTLDWAQSFDHVAGLLDEAEDGPVREHLASCEACRADSASLMVLVERLRSLGAVTALEGSDLFAERTLRDARAALGGRGTTTTTGVWRVATAESQRRKRAALRRRLALARVLKIAAAVVVLLGAGVGLAFVLGGVDFIVDRFGAGIEGALGVDLSDWGLRPACAAVARSAREAESLDDLRALSRELERILRRELSGAHCRAEAVVRLEFALTLARRGAYEAKDLVAALVEAARDVPAQEEALPTALLSVVRKARGLWRAGEAGAAREALVLPVSEGEAIALYYDGLAADRSVSEGVAPELVRAAEALRSVGAEVAWRLLQRDMPDEARRALAGAPAGPARDEAARLLARGAGE
jgi:hypothetical protein